jgi:hypothetical protein
VGFYEVLFAVSGVMRLVAAVAFLPGLREPDARPTVETIRFMGSNIYNNLFNAILMPLRALGVGDDDDTELPRRTREPDRPPLRRAA